MRYYTPVRSEKTSARPSTAIEHNQNKHKSNKEMKIKTTKKSAEKTVVAKKAAAKPVAKKAAKPAKKAVTFTVHAEKGKAVYLAGSYNEWSTTAKKMAYKAKNGI